MQFLEHSFNCVRLVYNDGIAATEAAFRAGEKFPGYVSLAKAMTASKRTPERAFLNEVSCTPLQQALRQLERAYLDYFRSRKEHRMAGKPRFRSSRAARHSLEFTRKNFKVAVVNKRRATLKLPKMSSMPVRISRPLPSPPSSATVIREADGRFYVSFVVQVSPRTYGDGKRVVGIDLGLTQLAVVAGDDGSVEEIRNPRHLQTKQRRLTLAQKAFARKAKGSANREKSRRKVAAIYRRVRETRLTHHHELARHIVDQSAVIGLETLSIRGLGRTRLAKAVHDAAWGILVRLIIDKADESGRRVHRVSQSYPSTRMCSECKLVGEKKPLHVRHWTCTCGAEHDRDINAARNLMLVAAGFAETINACGGKLSPANAPAHPSETGTDRHSTAVSRICSASRRGGQKNHVCGAHDQFA